jgi:hypothetical protein
LRKLVSLVGLVALLTASLAVPATTFAASNGSCDWLSHGNYFGGVSKVGDGSQSQQKRSVRAEIFTDTSRFDPCTGPLPGEDSDVSQWVAIEGAAADNGGNNIIQIGVTRCQVDSVIGDLPTNNPCHPSKAMDLRYFYAMGRDADDSCGLGARSPVARDLGPAVEDQWTVFEIIYEPDVQQIALKINFVEKMRFNLGSLCWFTHNSNKAAWRVEGWDPMDGVGGPATPARFRNMYLKDDSHLWESATWNGCGAASLDPRFNCHFFDNDAFGFSTGT